MSVAALAAAMCMLIFTILDRLTRLPMIVMIMVWTSLVFTPILAGFGLLWGKDAMRQPGGTRRRLGIASIVCSSISLLGYAGWFALIQFV